MIYTPRQKHRQMALLAGLLMTFAVPLILRPFNNLPWPALMLLPFILFTLSVFAYSLYAKRDDVFGVWIPSIPAVLYFFSIYLIRDFIPVVFNDGHTLIGGIAGHIGPFDLLGQLREVIWPILYVVACSLVGIGLKRLVRGEFFFRYPKSAEQGAAANP